MNSILFNILILCLLNASASLYYWDCNFKALLLRVLTHCESNLENFNNRNSDIALKIRHPQESCMSQPKQLPVKFGTEWYGCLLHVSLIFKNLFWISVEELKTCFIGSHSLCLLCEILCHKTTWTGFRNRKTCTADLSTSYLPSSISVSSTSAVLQNWHSNC